MKKLLSLILILVMATAFVPAPTRSADTITLITSAQQQVPPVAVTVRTAESNVVLIVVAICTGSNTTTAVTYAGAAMTKITQQVSATADPGTELSIWIKVNPASGSNNIATTCAGTSRVSYASFSGVNQTTGYNASATNACEYSTSAAHACGVTTQYDAGILVGGVISAATCTTLAVQANTTKWTPCNTENYLGWSSSSARTPVGAHDLGYTTSQAGTFVTAELIANGAVLAGASFKFWQFWDF